GWAALAAAAALFAAGIYVVDSSHRGEVFTTPVGGLSKVPTSDGSTITLNTDTRIRVQVSDTERRIDLDRGEAFYDGAQDPKRPFAVYANGKRVVAIGTKFSVRLQDEAVHVMVTEGTVRLEDSPGLLKRVTGGSRSSEHRLAAAGTIADIKPREVKVEQ